MLENYKMMFAMAIYEGSPAYEKPFNEFVNVSVLYGADYTAIVRPNSDTFYSGIWLDLRAEPIVLQVPAGQDSPIGSLHLFCTNSKLSTFLT